MTDIVAGRFEQQGDALAAVERPTRGKRTYETGYSPSRRTMAGPARAARMRRKVAKRGLDPDRLVQ